MRHLSQRPHAIQGGCGSLSHLCAVCGETNPSHDHWRRGNPTNCPRFGRPEDENRMYNEDVVSGDEDELNEVGGDQLRVIRLAIDIHMATVVLNAIPPSDRTARPAAAEAVDPGFPPGLLQTMHNDVMASLEDAAQIREAQQEIVVRHRQLMQNIVDTWRDVEQDMRARGLLDAHPHLAERLRDVAAAMIPNLDLYVELEHVQQAWDDFSQKHQEIMAFVLGRLRWLFDYLPEVFAAFLVHEAIAPERLAAAVPPPTTSVASAD